METDERRELKVRDKIRSFKMAPYVSGSLVIINILVFLVCTFGGQMLYNVGVLSPNLFLEKKQYYRLLTSMFLHGDISHLVNNMLLLFGLGAMIEKEIGHTVFAVAYFATGLGGSVASLFYKIFTEQWQVGSIGASGAVFGLIGVLFALAFFSGIDLPNVTPIRMVIVVVYSVYSGMGNPNIDNAAHIGGVVTGVFIGLIMCLFIRQKQSEKDMGGYHED